jgi:endogenous inhibitor of DNA gyrase (YacG/DUF329 family)
MFEKCTNCSVRVVRGRRDELGVFCSKICQNFYRYPGFCNSCEAATTPQVAGSTTTINGIGTSIYGSKDPCPECGSAIQTKFFVVLFIPFIPLGRFRTKWTCPGQYLSRKVKSAKQLNEERLNTGAAFHSPMGR